MKLTKLLTGAAVAALLTGAASAQVVTELRIDENVGAGTTIPATGITLASEYDATKAANQQVEFTIVPRNATNTADLDAGFAAYAGTSVDITVSVSGGIFPTALVAANHPATGTGGACAPTLVSGGLAGESSAVFRIADLAACDDDGTTAGFGDTDSDEAALGFLLPIDLTGSTANVSYTMATTATGAAVSSDAFNRAAVDPVLVAGTQALTSLVIGTPGFAVTVAGSDREAQLSTTGVSYNALDAGGVIGTLTFANETVGGGALVSVGGAAANWDLAAQVDEITVVVTLDDATGFESVTLNGTGTNDTTVALTGNSATFTLTDTASTGLDTTEVKTAPVSVVLNEDSDDTTLINEGNFSIAVSTGAATGTDLTIGGGSDVEQITREGESSATFEWVGDATASTSNVFRFTGLSTTQPPAISFIVTNASADDSLNDEYALGTYTPSAGGELIVTNAQLAGIIGSDFGRADIRFFVEGAVDDIRRFHVTEGVITLGNDN
ncbi:hypothetical protein [Oceanicaulis sp.]|uniref:hypothetical protein n=1 Tax=Oceanicaulis sp. TaxID=1924941 RepID=UPI003BAAB42A